MLTLTCHREGRTAQLSKDGTDSRVTSIPMQRQVTLRNKFENIEMKGERSLFPVTELRFLR